MMGTISNYDAWKTTNPEPDVEYEYEVWSEEPMRRLFTGVIDYDIEDTIRTIRNELAKENIEDNNVSIVLKKFVDGVNICEAESDLDDDNIFEAQCQIESYEPSPFDYE